MRNDVARIAGWIRWAGTVGALLLVGAADARALNHYLLAQPGNSFQGQSTSDQNVSHVEALYQNGVGGVNPSFFSHEASADSASGLLSLTSTFSLGGGAGDPIQPSTNPRSAVRIEESIDPGTPTADTVVIHATLTWSGVADIDSLSGDVDSAKVAALLATGSCQTYFSKRFYSNGLSENDPIPCTSSASYSSTASEGLLEVTRFYPASAIDSNTRFTINTQIEAEANFLEYLDQGQWTVSGSLSVSMEGAPFTAYSPTFLSAVPEADAAYAEAAAIAALAFVRRRRD